MEREKELILYQARNGKEPVRDWLFSIDKAHRYRVQARIDRIRHGNYGDHKRFYGLIEIRMGFGKGYRLYCAEDGQVLVVLLAAGDKADQQKDIEKAMEYWRDYNEQKKISNI